jgi:asparagine synthase (glutamine-hydrolysing)
MCGIAGVVYADKNHPVDRGFVERMTRIQRYRGPDAEGYYFDHGVGLGHRRLSIIDLAGGDQPIFNEDRSKAVILNGEIYNFAELRNQLEGLGHTFRTRSDTEVIVHAYEAWGEQCVERFWGMFAFAVWDNATRTLFLARDRVGKKPLYYFVDGERLIFASELKGVVQDSLLERRVNPEALDSYLTFRTVTAPQTIFRGIFQLSPAHTLTFRNGQVRLREYWDLEFPDVPVKSETEYNEELTALFSEAVGCRLISDVPLGAFLSGGVDSSAVVATMADLSSQPVLTETAGFQERKWDESGYAQAVSGRLGTDHHKVTVMPRSTEILPRLVWHFDEPFADPSAIPTYYVCKAARERVTVALSGDGGDETFGGYQRRYSKTLLAARIRPWIPEWWQQKFVGPLGAAYPKWDRLPRALRLKNFLLSLSMPFEQAYSHDKSFLFRPEMKAGFYTADMCAAANGNDPVSFFEPTFKRVRDKDPLTQIMYVDFKTTLSNDMLTKVDRMSMANSLEVRCPLLHHRLIEFAARLPADVKYRGQTSKYLLKRYLERWLPKELIHRPKMGFSVPLDHWLRGELRPLAEELLLSNTALARGYFEPKALQGLWKAHCNSMSNYAPQLWGLMMLELWHRTFVDRVPTAPLEP